jgi:hypothetical protein
MDLTDGPDYEGEPVNAEVSMMRFVKRFGEYPTLGTLEDDRDTSLFWAQIAQAQAAERQAAAAEKQAASTQETEAMVTEILAYQIRTTQALERIAAVLEHITTDDSVNIFITDGFPK